MKPKIDQRVKIGIIGCGAIGSRIARSIKKDFQKDCRLTGIYDIDQKKADRLGKSLSLKKITKRSIPEVIKDCDCMVEACTAKNTRDIIRQVLEAKKSGLCMSVGKLLNSSDLFSLAKRNHCHVLLPSGAIAGIDAVKAASLVGIDTITLTTRKPPIGFADNPYLAKKGIDPSRATKETVIFEGNVTEAVKAFPRNINVAATLTLASQCRKKVLIRIIVSPEYHTNSHTIELTGKFGRIVTQTDNFVCPDNPKTSYLAVLSGLQTLKQYCTGVFIGT
jgi:aspartate dehydrogenase